MYTGNFKQGLKSGQGTLICIDGSEYSGEWHKDTAKGFGTMKYANGDSYTGNWHYNSFHGKGSYTHAVSGDTEEGKWSHGCRMRERN